MHSSIPISWATLLAENYPMDTAESFHEIASNAKWQSNTSQPASHPSVAVIARCTLRNIDLHLD